MFDCCFRLQDNEKPTINQPLIMEEIYAPKREYKLANVIENKKVTWITNPSMATENSLEEFNILLKKMRGIKINSTQNK
jgi:hypothetical protein